MNLENLSPEKLRKLADIQQKIADLTKQRGALLGSSGAKRKRKPLSKAAKAKISASVTKRWAEKKAKG